MNGCRAKQVKIGIKNSNCSDYCEIYNTSCSWDWYCKGGFKFRLSSFWSSLPLCPYDSVHSSTCYEYWYVSYTFFIYILHHNLNYCFHLGPYNWGLFHLMWSLNVNVNVGTMTQLFDVAQEECSVLFLWTYLVAALALTGWSTVFMWILS